MASATAASRAAAAATTADSGIGVRAVHSRAAAVNSSGVVESTSSLFTPRLGAGVRAAAQAGGGALLAAFAAWKLGEMRTGRAPVL